MDIWRVINRRSEVAASPLAAFSLHHHCPVRRSSLGDRQPISKARQSVAPSPILTTLPSPLYSVLVNCSVTSLVTCPVSEAVPSMSPCALSLLCGAPLQPSHSRDKCISSFLTPPSLTHFNSPFSPVYSKL